MKLVKITKGGCRNCGCNKSQKNLLSKRQEQKFFFDFANFKLGHRSVMSNSAWCNLKICCTIIKLLDLCHSPKCICQKQIPFTPIHFQLEGGSIKTKLPKNF